jgi:hypothetical protein
VSDIGSFIRPEEVKATSHWVGIKVGCVVGLIYAPVVDSRARSNFGLLVENISGLKILFVINYDYICNVTY